jgi:hypothetical protein
MVKLRHKPISNQRSIIPRSTPSMEGGTETALTMKRNDKPKKWTDAEVQLLLALSREGAGAVQIASALDRYISSVKRVAENFGLHLRA